MITTRGVTLARVNFEHEVKPITDAELPDRPRVKHVAQWMGVSPMSVYRWIHKGDIPCKRVGKRTYIFEKAALLEWAKPHMEAI